MRSRNGCGWIASRGRTPTGMILSFSDPARAPDR